jgi:hypothetical protein
MPPIAGTVQIGRLGHTNTHPTPPHSPAFLAVGGQRPDSRARSVAWAIADTPKYTFRLSDKDIELLDKARGSADRSGLRSLIAEAARGRQRMRSATPTRAEALALQAEHAEYDARAAERLLQEISQDEQLERLRGVPDVS